MKDYLSKIETSFKKAMAGKEEINNVIWFWGAIFYVLAFFVIDKAVKAVDFLSFDIFVSVVMVIYAVWHLYVLRKCKPKKPKLSKEEKKILKEKARKDFGKRFLRKLFLKEPVSKGNPATVAVVLDLFLIAHFASYLF